MSEQQRNILRKRQPPVWQHTWKGWSRTERNKQKTENQDQRTSSTNQREAVEYGTGRRVIIIKSSAQRVALRRVRHQIKARRRSLGGTLQSVRPRQDLSGHGSLIIGPFQTMRSPIASGGPIFCPDLPGIFFRSRATAKLLCSAPHDIKDARKRHK